MAKVDYKKLSKLLGKDFHFRVKTIFFLKTYIICYFLRSLYLCLNAISETAAEHFPFAIVEELPSFHLQFAQHHEHLNKYYSLMTWIISLPSLKKCLRYQENGLKQYRQHQRK